MYLHMIMYTIHVKALIQPYMWNKWLFWHQVINLAAVGLRKSKRVQKSKNVSPLPKYLSDAAPLIPSCSGGRLSLGRAQLQEGLPGELVQRGGPLLPSGRLRPEPGPGRGTLPQRVQPAAGLHVRQRLAGCRARAQLGGHQLQHVGQRVALRELLRHHHAAHGAAALPALLRSLHLRVSGVQTWRRRGPRLSAAGRRPPRRHVPELHDPPDSGPPVQSWGWDPVADSRPAGQRVPLHARHPTHAIAAPVPHCT